MKWIDDIEAKELSSPIGHCGPNYLYSISNPEDARLAFYRLAKLRDHKTYSWFHKLMIDKKRNPVSLLSKTVVIRALRGVHEIISMMLTDEIYKELRELIAMRHLVEGVYIVSRPTFEQCVGLPGNSVQASACLIDLQSATSIQPIPGLCTANQINLRTSSIDCEQCPDRCEQYLWQETCVFDIDRHPEAASVSPPILILDDVRSSDNIGVLMRTAFSLGVKGLIVTRDSFAAIGCRAGRTSMGALAFLSVYVTGDLIRTIDELQRLHIEVIGTSPRGQTNIHFRDHRKWALVMGNEDKGSSDEVMKKCDTCHRIPQVAGDSLSVSVAAGICLYELSRVVIGDCGVGAGDC